MSINRRNTASDLVRLAGRLPAMAAALTVAGTLLFPSFSMAQDNPVPTQPKPAQPQQPPGTPPAGQPPAVQPPAPPPAPTGPVVRPPPPPRQPAGGQPAGDQPKVVVSEHKTVDLHVKDEDLNSVLEMLSIQAQKNIVASKSVGGKVSATLYGVTFFEALDSILHVNGFGYLEQGNFIYVYTLEELEKIQKALNKRVAKAIKLNYLNAKDAEEFVKPLLSKDGGEIKTSKAAAEFKISEDLPSGNEEYALGATLVIYDYEENIKAIEAMIAEIDTRPAQVLVEATILQTSLNENNAFGADFSVIEDINFDDFLSPLDAANALVRGQGLGGVSPSDNQATAITSSPGRAAGPSTLKVGIIAGNVSMFFRFLDSVADTTIVSNPKLLALNRQASRVLVGRRVGYLSTTATDTSTTQTVEFLDTGTQLYFRPFVSSNGEIRMELKPQVSEAIIREQTDATGAAVTIPDEITQGVTTNVMVRDGQTIVLGGLFKESTMYQREQVPWLGDIPIIGTAFKGHEDEIERSEIIFLIKPTIVTDSLLADAAKRANEDAERLRVGSRQGLLPWSREKMTAALLVDAENNARNGNFAKALWGVRRSLSLKPMQADAYRLRDRILNQREIWPNPSSMDYMFDAEVAERVEGFTPPDPAPKWKTQYGAKRVPFQPIPPAAGPGAQFTPESQDVTTPLSEDQATHIAEHVFFVPSPEPVTAPTPSGNPSDSLALQSTGNPYVARLEGSDLGAEVVRRLLPTIRSQIQTFRDDNDGVLPTMGSENHRGWAELIDEGLIRMPVTNVWVGGPNCDVVITRTTPDAGFHRDYGWIFNPETGQLWAAGFDASDRPFPRKPVNTTVGVETTGK
jgi:type IV pilus secretin PilQ/predicted competence protein